MPTEHVFTRLALLLSATLWLSACAATPATPAHPDQAAVPSATAAASASLADRPHETLQGTPAKVLVVVEENHGQTAALTDMPYLASLAHGYARTTAYSGVAHPSLPNYLAIAGGSTFGVTDDRDPARHPVSGPSVFDQAIAAHQTARTYAEGMPSPCALTGSGRYGVKHNPWAYFTDPSSRANCRQFDVPAGSPTAGALRKDVDSAALPNVGLLIPDLCHDGHDCSLQQADDWLRSWLPVVMNGPDYLSGKLAIIVTFDEDSGTDANSVLTTLVSPYVSHTSSSAPFTHYSLSRSLSELTGSAPLHAAAGAPPLLAAFHPQ